MKTKTRSMKGKRKRKVIVVSTVNEDHILIGAAKIAASKAIRSSKALGLSFKIIKGGKIVSVHADKSEEIEREISKSTIDVSKLKKGMSLERK
jgi:hypothetical protein